MSASGALAFVGSGGGIEVVTADTLAKTGRTTTRRPRRSRAGSHERHPPDLDAGRRVHRLLDAERHQGGRRRPGPAWHRLSFLPHRASCPSSAATDRIVTLAGTSPTDLVGALIAVSQHRWADADRTIPPPAGGGVHGPYGFSATIVAADDPATAQKELAWGGAYGPTLLSTAHDTFDPG